MDDRDNRLRIEGALSIAMAGQVRRLADELRADGVKPENVALFIRQALADFEQSKTALAEHVAASLNGKEIRAALAQAVDQVLAPPATPPKKRRLTYSDVEKRISREQAQAVARQVAKARADGANEFEIKAYLDEARVFNRKERERLMNEIVAWDRDGYAITAPKTLQ